MISVTNVVLLVTMATNAKKLASVIFLAWMSNVITGMDSVIVNQVMQIYTVMKLVLLVRMDSIVRTNVHVKTTPLVIQYLDFVIVLRDSRELTAKKWQLK